MYGKNSYVSNLLVEHRFRGGKEPRTTPHSVGVSHPRGRMFHVTAWDHDRQSIWMFGGSSTARERGQKVNFNTLWEFQTNSMQWVEYDKIKGAPAARSGSCMVYYDKKLWLFGGTRDRASKETLKNMFYLDLSDYREWKWKLLKLPPALHNANNGADMQVVNHPMVGPRIIFT